MRRLHSFPYLPTRFPLHTGQSHTHSSGSTGGLAICEDEHTLISSSYNLDTGQASINGESQPTLGHTHTYYVLVWTRLSSRRVSSLVPVSILVKPVELWTLKVTLILMTTMDWGRGGSTPHPPPEATPTGQGTCSSGCQPVSWFWWICRCTVLEMYFSCNST